MSGLSPLLPEVMPEVLLPGDAAFMARTDLFQTRMLGYSPLNLDAVTTLLLGLLGTRPTVRHRSGVTDEILSFLGDAGIAVDEDMHVFDAGVEAEAAADRLVAQGYRLFWPYPLREGRYSDDAHLVSPDLWRRLNSKERLSDLVPASALADRHILRLSDDGSGRFPGPAFLKAAGDAATGWGYAVRHAPDADAYVDALAHFRAAGLEAVIVERAIDILTCWCANIAVGEVTTVYLGAAQQVFSAPGRQSGSLIDPDNPLPHEGAALAVAAGEAARRLGFRGMAGLDIGLATDGRLVVFDPNFRFNSSAAQILLHPSAARRSGLPASVSFSAATPLPMSDMLRQAAGPVSEGWFVPTRLLDARLLPAAEGLSLCTGFVLGNDPQDAAERAHKLQALLVRK